MEIKFYTPGTKVEKETKKYLAAKIEKLKKHISNQNVNSQIEINSLNNSEFRVEIQIKFPGNHYISEEKGTKIEEAGDLALADMERQIKKDKDKRRTLQQRGAMSIKKKMSIDKGARF
ncbi:MAG: ribosome-associated translation inhibitor RaiA [Candidatus Moranbacteria bacterium]|nr:ribosome-associated translation inhibitor RaiA [Candidatus Moranbacteria bacterium]